MSDREVSPASDDGVKAGSGNGGQAPLGPNPSASDVGSAAVPKPDGADKPEVVDLEVGPSAPDFSAAPIVEPYDPAKAQETMRGQIAIILLFILCLVIAFAFYYLERLPLGPATKDYTANLVTVLQIIFGPIVALVGTALGYYFGSKGAGKS